MQTVWSIDLLPLLKVKQLVIILDGCIQCIDNTAIELLNICINSAEEYILTIEIEYALKRKQIRYNYRHLVLWK